MIHDNQTSSIKQHTIKNKYFTIQLKINTILTIYDSLYKDNVNYLKSLTWIHPSVQPEEMFRTGRSSLSLRRYKRLRPEWSLCSGEVLGRMIGQVRMTSVGQTGPQECAGCNKKIHDKFILKVGTAHPLLSGGQQANIVW